MADVFAIDTHDYAGVPVRCTREWWEEHIVARRPWLAGSVGQVTALLVDPDRVFSDRHFDNRGSFLRRVASDRYIKAVVEYRHVEQGLEGRLVTVYLDRGRRPGDTLVYRREAPE